MSLSVVLGNLAPAVISALRYSKFSFASSTSALSLPFLITRMLFFYATDLLVYAISNIPSMVFLIWQELPLSPNIVSSVKDGYLTPSMTQAKAV